jgi:hypothetical protein
VEYFSVLRCSVERIFSEIIFPFSSLVVKWCFQNISIPINEVVELILVSFSFLATVYAY